MANLLSWLNDNVRDVFDANTQKDQQKRLAAGQPRFYQDQQRQKQQQAQARQQQIIRQANPTNITKPILGVTIGDIAREIPSAVGQITQGSKDVAKGFVANPIKVGKLIAYPIIQDDMSKKLDRGEISYDTYNKIVSQAADEAGIGINDDTGTVARKVGGAVGGTALDILTAGSMSPKAAVGLKTGVLGKAAPYAAPLANRVAAGVGTGALLGGANLMQRDEITPEQAAYDIGGGAILGGVVPAGIHGIGKAWQKLFPKQAADAADTAVQARLANRPANLRAIEQNPNLDDAQRLALAQDPGQAGLKLPQAQRDAMLADFRAKIGTPKVGRPIANNVDPADLQGAALQSHLGKADLQAQQAADLAASKARAASPEVQQQALKIRHFQDPMKDLEIKRFDPNELKINRFEPPTPDIPVKRMTVPGIDPKTGMGRIDLTDGKPIKNTFDGPLPKSTSYHRQAEVEKSGLVNMSNIKDISEYSRAGSRLSDESVTYWEKQIKSGKNMPPIIINEAGEVLDGRHRLTALKNLGVEDGPIIRLTKAQEAAIGPVKGQNLKPEYIIDTLLNDGKTPIKRPAYIPPPDMGTPMGQYEPRIPPGLNDGPSMLGKGRIGNDVPQSYLEPPKEKPPITEQGTANIVVGPPKGIRNLDIIKEDIGSAKANFYNRFDSIEKLVKKVELERGVKLKPSENPTYLVKQFLGGGGIANAKIDMELTPIIKQTKNFDGLREYLVATRMNELAQRGLSKRGDDMLADLSKRVGPEEIANFDKISKELYKYQQKNLDDLLEVGVLTPEQHANILAKNQNYIPFNRVLPDVVQGTTQSGQKIRVGQSPIKAIKGSDKDIIDPIESMIRNTYDIQAVVQKQKVLRSLVDLAPDEFVPLKSTASRNTPSMEMFINGKRQKFETSKPISDALNSMNEERLNAVVRMMSLPAKMLRSGATSLNVAFALPNIVRDQLSAAVNSKYGGVPIYDFVSGLASVIKKDDAYKKWILSGADQASFFAQDRTTLSRGVQDITGGYKYKAGKLIKNPLELFRIAGDLSEKGSRVGVFKRAMRGAAKEGLTGEDLTLAAMRESREATIDFSQRGSKMKAYNALVPFLNARVQGTGKLIQSFKQRPVQTMAIGASIASVPAGVLYAYNTMDPEREKTYNEIPEYIKREYFVMVTGDKETPFIKIPKGEVGKIFGNPVESFLASMKTNDPAWKSTATSVIDSFLPVGSIDDPTRFITDSSPTAVAVPYQMLSNYDAFRKSPIIGQFQKDLAPEQQYSKYNTETGKKIGAALGVSPAMLEFGISGFTGGLGRQGLQMADIAQGVDIPRNEMPVMSRFLGKEKDLRDSANQIYEEADKARIAKARENFKLKKRFQEGDQSAIEGLDTSKQNDIRRAVAEDQIKETLNPKEKALWSLPNKDLESMAERDKDAQTVLDLKDSLKSETSKSSKKKSYQKIRVGKPPKVKTSRARKGRKAKVVKPNAKIESSIKRIASSGSRVKTGRLSTTVRRPRFTAKALPKIKAPRNYA